jgi:hypothetical protein
MMISMTVIAPKWPCNLVIVRHAESERNIWKEIATARGEFVYDGKLRDMDVPLSPRLSPAAILANRQR